MIEHNEHEDGSDDGLRAFRGLMLGCAISMALWAAVIGATVLIRSCHEVPAEQFRPAQSNEVKLT